MYCYKVVTKERLLFEGNIAVNFGRAA